MVVREYRHLRRDKSTAHASALTLPSFTRLPRVARPPARLLGGGVFKRKQKRAPPSLRTEILATTKGNEVQWWLGQAELQNNW